MRLYAVDGNGISHWLWHASKADQNGNEMSLDDSIRDWFSKFNERLSPTHMAVFFDGARNWRLKAFAEYKSARAAKPVDQDKLAALKAAPEAWRSLGVPTFSYDEFEADDAIASVCNAFASPECEVIVVATDKDMMQLVGDHVKQYDPRPNKANEYVFYDEAKVEDKLGVPPWRVVDLLAIMGDSSDSIPGVPDWGKVRAVNAIKQTKSLSEIMRKAKSGALEKISVENQALLAANIPALELSRSLVELRLDVQVPAGIDAFHLGERGDGNG